MQAIVISQYGGPEQLVLEDIPTPVPENGEVLIKVKAFGINRAETEMRKGTWFEIARVSGIECVGQVEYDPSGKLVRGQTVAAIMGGMGRTRLTANFSMAFDAGRIPMRIAFSLISQQRATFTSGPPVTSPYSLAVSSASASGSFASAGVEPEWK